VAAAAVVAAAAAAAAEAEAAEVVAPALGSREAGSIMSHFDVVRRTGGCSVDGTMVVDGSTGAGVAADAGTNSRGLRVAASRSCSAATCPHDQSINNQSINRFASKRMGIMYEPRAS